MLNFYIDLSQLMETLKFEYYCISFMYKMLSINICYENQFLK